jgi:hypothetical protein
MGVFKLQLLGATIVLACAIGIASSAYGEEESVIRGDQPEIQFKSSSVNLGPLFRGQRVVRTFPFKNNGLGFLEIRSIHSACGCINTKVLPKIRFAPNEEGQISVEFDSSWFAGSVQRTITVDSNDPNQTTTVLTLKSDIKEEIRATPTIVTLGEVGHDTTKEFKVKVDIFEKSPDTDTTPRNYYSTKIPADQEKLRKEIQVETSETKILAAIASSQFIDAIITPNGAKSAILNVRFRDPLPAGPFRERITIWNTSTHLKELIIPVVGEVVPLTRLSNNYVEFGAVGSGRKSKRTIALTSRRKDFLVQSVEIDLRKTTSFQNLNYKELIGSRSLKTEDGYSIALELLHPGTMPSHTHNIGVSGTAIVKTNDPDHKEFRIPFFGVLNGENAQ